MKKDKRKVFFEYVPEDPLMVLKNFKPVHGSKEVLYTLGDQEIVKEDGKFYLCHTIYPNLNKEITRELATEIWQDKSLKSRADISMTFDL